MREIKLRAFYEGEMWDVVAIDLINKDSVSLRNDRARKCVTWPDGKTWEGDLTLMQFTGLKDSEGVEIWEGDVVEGECVSDNHEEFKERQIVQIVLGEITAGYFLPFDKPESMRVIGNIFENGDLVDDRS